jgi:hypothetical protein
LRWQFNGVLALQDLFFKKRIEAIENGDYDSYMDHVEVFEREIETRLYNNS